MWVKSKNLLSPNYTTVQEEKAPSTTVDLHFYITGADVDTVDNVADAVEDLMNHGTKSKYLKKNIILDEILLLENGIRIGVAGKVNNIRLNEERPEYDNSNRGELLKRLTSKM